MIPSTSTLHFRHGRMLSSLLAATVGLSLTSASIVRADDPPQIAGATLVSRDPVELSKYLGKTYKKEAEGFCMTMPADARIIERQGIDLVSFVVDAKSWGGSLQLVPLRTPMSLKEFLESSKQELKSGKTFKAVQILEEKLQKKDDKSAARMTISMEAELGSGLTTGAAEKMGIKNAGQIQQQVSLYRQQLVVQMKKDDQNKSNQFLVLTFYAPLKDKEVANKTFEAMLDEFDLFDPSTLREKRINAFKAGKEWLTKHTADEYASKLINQRQVFRILIGGQDAGFIQFDETTKELDSRGSQVDVVRDRRKGVLLAVNVRTFGSQGIVIGKNDAFWSYSQDSKGTPLGHYSIWNNLSEIQPANSAKRQQATLVGKKFDFPWVQETGTLTQDAPSPQKPDRRYMLGVTFGGDPSQHYPQNLHQQIPPEENSPLAPLPRILEYTWPRFVDVTKPLEMSFVTYNSKARKLATITLIATGRKESVNINGKTVNCYKCIEEIDPDSTTMYVDESGRIQMLVTSDQSVTVPTTVEAMVAKWGNLLKD